MAETTTINTNNTNMGLLSPSTNIMPDLSHLTEEERKIIESVMMRQKKEEEKEAELLKKKQDEVVILENAIRKRNEEQKKLGLDMEATCQICLKTKFADGIGHVCNYCNVRCCARCGGKVALRSNKNIWVCILCRKKQELLIKTGQWMHSSMANRLQQLEAESMLSGGDTPLYDQHDPFIMGKENQISNQIGRRRSLGLMMNNSSVDKKGEFKRQFSHDSQPQQHQALHWGETLFGLGHLNLTKPLKHILPQTPSKVQLNANAPLLTSQRIMPDIPLRSSRLDQQSNSSSSLARKTLLRSLSSESEPLLIMKGNLGSGRKLPRQRSKEIWELTDNTSGVSSVSFGEANELFMNTSMPIQTSMNTGKQLPAITPEQQQQAIQAKSSGGLLIGSAINVPSCEFSQNLFSSNGFSRNNNKNQLNEQLSSATTLQVNSQPVHRTRHGHGRIGNTENAMVIRNDSLSSDQSECQVRPPPKPPKPHKIKSKLASRLRHYSSISSSDDEIRSTPEYSTEEDQEFDIESESISEKGDHFNRSHLKCQRILKPEEILDAKIKKFLAHPITWKPSTDGTRLIGHMILKKHLSDDSGQSSSATILGLKVVGGKILDSGRLGALIEKVKKGSIADTIGRLRPGDEVVEWNGRSLQGKTYEEVYDIIAESKQEPQVELIVSRPVRRIPLSSNTFLRDDLLGPQNRIGRRHTDVSQSGFGQHSLPGKTIMRGSSLGAEFTRSTRPSMRLARSSTISGRIQVKLWYDIQSLQLVVTIVGAIELSPRKNGSPRNPYAKMFLLPDRSEKSKRRTKTVANTLEPRWNQTFIYSPLRRTEMKSKALEISVWDYDRFGGSEFLGEALIELSVAPLDDEGEWYMLGTHEETIAQLTQQQKSYLITSDRLSPPSTISRLSDSDVSELDLDEGFNTSRESWRGLLADTSQSSIASSGSSPPLHPTTSSGERYSDQLFSDRRRARHGHLTGTVTGSSLPNYYDVLDRDNLRFGGASRPEFRKSSSQPSRSLSPPLSLPSRSPSHSVVETPTGSYMSKKRHLPPIPSHRHMSRERERVVPNITLDDRTRNWRSSLQHRRSTETMTPLAMYSDSEVSARPVFSDRQIYAHPHHYQHHRGSSSQSHYHRHQYEREGASRLVRSFGSTSSYSAELPQIEQERVYRGRGSRGSGDERREEASTSRSGSEKHERSDREKREHERSDRTSRDYNRDTRERRPSEVTRERRPSDVRERESRERRPSDTRERRPSELREYSSRSFN